jgi:hypothetical protein
MLIPLLRHWMRLTTLQTKRNSCFYYTFSPKNVLIFIYLWQSSVPLNLEVQVQVLAFLSNLKFGSRFSKISWRTELNRTLPALSTIKPFSIHTFFGLGPRAIVNPQ